MSEPPSVQDVLHTALRHHQAGRLREAEAIYRQVLGQHPDEPEALHGLGILARQAGRNDIALRLIGRAAQLSPNVPAYHHNLGDTLLVAADPAQAAVAFRNALRLPNNIPASRVGLGIALMRQKQFTQAVEEFRLAIALGAEQPHVYQHLASALLDVPLYREAEEACRQALERGGASAELYQTLGEALGKQNRLEEAVGAFSKAIELRPDFHRPYVGIGVALATLRRHEEAERHFRRAIDLKPDFPQAYFNLGVMCLRQKRYEDAVAHLRKSLELDPNYFDARAQLVEALSQSGRRPEAVTELEALAKLRPGNRDVEFALAALSGRDAPPQPPPSTVAKLFDEYAEVFDKHLSENLRYRAPQVLFDAITAAGPPPRPNVLDLGCGTGLCGELFRPTAATLSGVDVSPAMIAKARARAIYDHLEVGDLIASLRTAANRYEIITAADVFVYLGDLSDVLTAAAAALNPGGLFGFTVEAAEGGTYVLQPSRRYAHSPHYVRDAGKRAGLEIVSMDRAPLRTEGKHDVIGLVTVLRKPAGDAS